MALRLCISYSSVTNTRVPEKVLEKIIATIPAGRLGEAREIARVVVFLAADDAGVITGSILSVNGGQHIF